MDVQPRLIDWSLVPDTNMFVKIRGRYYLKCLRNYVVRSSSAKQIKRRKDTYVLFMQFSTRGAIVGCELVVLGEHTPVVSGPCVQLLTKNKTEISTRFSVKKIDHFNGLYVTEFTDGCVMFLAHPVKRSGGIKAAVKHL